MKRIISFLALAFVAVACQDDGPTVPTEGPEFAKPAKCEPWPSCRDGGDDGDDGGNGKAEITLCAKESVVDQINSFVEGTTPDWEGPTIDSTDEPCRYPEGMPTSEPMDPKGTLKYSTEGPVFEWTFKGDGFLSVSHTYVLIVYPDPWPGRGLICLEEDNANIGGRLHFSGRRDLHMDLTDAKIWIVRAGWVDCGDGWFNSYLQNPEDNPRLTNDGFDPSMDFGDDDALWDNCEGPDATYTPIWQTLAYDWAFENALINYTDTDD